MSGEEDSEILHGLAKLWTPGTPALTNPYADNDIRALVEFFQARHGVSKHLFEASAMINALRSLGCPRLARATPSDTSPQVVKMALDSAYSGAQVTVRHLCPLDLLDWFPGFTVIPGVTVGQLSENELEQHMRADQLQIFFPGSRIDSERLSKFHWLIVEEIVSPTGSPASRGGFTLFDEPIDGDHGRIDPYRSRYPAAMEEALFCMLLGAWENWTGRTYDWRGFEAPWVYTVSDDLLSRPTIPPTADNLSWEDAHQPDDHGNEVCVGEKPVRLNFDIDTNDAAREITNIANAFNAVKASPLFETPIVHSFVRAFLAGGIDEFIYHLMTIEAGLGVRSDHYARLRPQPDRHKNTLRGATDRVKRRLDNLLGAGNGDIYEELFNLRSRYLHGRGGMEPIPWKKRLAARVMARRVICELIERAPACTKTRDEFLNDLLQEG